MNILMISATFPYPPTSGGTQVRTFNLLKYLSQNHQITLVTQINKNQTENDIKSLGKWVQEIILIPAEPVIKTNLIDKIKRFNEFLIQGIPPHVQTIYSVDIQNWLDQAISGNKFDVITCEHSINEIYIRPEWTNIHKVVNIHSSVYGTCKNQLATNTTDNMLRESLNLPLLWRYEKRYCQKFSAIVVTTEEDKKQIQTFNSAGKITVIPNGVDLDLFPERQQDLGEKNLIFIGAMDNTPNIDAVRFLSVEIFPKLREKYPDVQLKLVGNRPVDSVLELGKIEGISIKANVPSMVDYLHQSTVCVIPMRTGFGIKNKTLEAMAAGIPVVGSDRALEGLLVDGEKIPLRALRANTIDEYITSISRLFEDSKLRQQLAKNGRYLIESEYTWSKIGENYEKVCLNNIETV